MSKRKDCCSFCGRNDVPLFEGMDGAYICPDCIERGHQIVTEEMQKLGAKNNQSDFLPQKGLLQPFLELLEAALSQKIWGWGQLWEGSKLSC